MLADFKLKESLSSQPDHCPEDLARAIAAPRLDGSLVDPISYKPSSRTRVLREVFRELPINSARML